MGFATKAGGGAGNGRAADGAGGDGMSDFGEGKWVVGRKKHRCEWCYGPIPQGEKHYYYRGISDGAWQSWRMHKECEKDYAANEDSYGEYFISGEAPMPERVRQLVEYAQEESA